MLIPHNHVKAGLHQQRGVVLIIALIVLVAMTLAGIALVRSVDTTNVIAGNLAFKQATTSSGDSGVTEGVTWLSNAANISAMLYLDNKSAAYIATCPNTLLAQQLALGQVVCNPTSTQSWAQWWSNLELTCALPNGICPKRLAADGAGNTVYYIIQRMCQSLGTDSANPNYGNPNAPSGGAAECARTSAQAVSNDHSGSSTEVLDITSGIVHIGGVYYRITAHITGPNNTSSFIQTFIAQ